MHDRKKHLSLFSIIAATMLAACTQTSLTKPMVTVIQKDAYEATVHYQVNAPSFTLTIKNHNAPVDTEEVHALDILHVTVASDDLQEFFHTYTAKEQKQSGTYDIPFRLSSEKNYTIWLDIPSKASRDHHGAQLEYRGVLHVENIALAEPIYPPVQTEFALQNGYKATLTIPNPLVAGGSTIAPHISLEDRSGNPVSVLDNADHFYVVVGPHEYRLEHMNHYLSTSTELALNPLIFNEPGHYIVWAEIYVQNGSEVEILQPQFTINAQNKAAIIYQE
ncbi:MAG: hypothetical protein KC680_03480 [Candidatus Peregrinibacteria bacterium]|nr:hypothetical protein [Candidatus Peregrinibacteria bacterium]MCB9808407.1 hypothetical protein [Candidatus Peribacteria bacterium]